MTHEEAVKVCEILAQADGGCPVCVKALMDMFARQFADHVDAIDEVMQDEDWWNEEKRVCVS